MKQHKIALEQVQARMGQVAASRLAPLYDAAMAQIKGRVTDSIQQPAGLKMHVASMDRDTTKFVRVTDTETGYYVKLTMNSGAPESVTLEVGHLLLIEEAVNGQQNIRAW